jgi:DNA-binding transcriptional LysR family regulator
MEVVRVTSATRSAPLLDERLLRLFDVLYATRSVSRAAAALGQAQPTVSIWLGRLREELNDQLFVRTPSGMNPTPRADELIGTVRSAIELLQRLREGPPAYDPAEDPRRFRICMTDASHVTLLPQLLTKLRDKAPNARLEALPISPATGHLLESGEADLALGRLPSLESGFYQQTLYGQDWVCLAGRSRIAKGEFTLAEYENAAHVAIVAGTGDDLLATSLTQSGIERRVVLELPGFLGLGAVIAGTDLIATLPRHTSETLAKANGLKVLPCPFPVASFLVKQHWHARYHHDPASQWLRSVCAKLFQKRRDRLT